MEKIVGALVGKNPILLVLRARWLAEGARVILSRQRLGGEWDLVSGGVVAELGVQRR